MRRRLRCYAFSALFFGLSLGVAGCAKQADNSGAPADAAAAEEEDFNDPIEDTNRAIFSFNLAVDRNFLLPVAKAYRSVLPDPIRDSLRDFFQNLRGPIILVNDALQGEFTRAGDTLARFAINSTIGLGGMVDVAGRWGIPYHSEDFGQTLAVWGIPEGLYLMLPVLGPSNPRDAAGDVAEGFADPWNRIATNHHRIWVTFVRGGISGIDERSRNIESLADIERTALDFYATIRSLYRQRRQALIRNQDRDLPANPSGFQSQTTPSPASPEVAKAPNISEVSVR
jgi:phospholipid-binding lipoprotein MlaA